MAVRLWSSLKERAVAELLSSDSKEVSPISYPHQHSPTLILSTRPVLSNAVNPTYRYQVSSYILQPCLRLWTKLGHEFGTAAHSVCELHGGANYGKSVSCVLSYGGVRYFHESKYFKIFSMLEMCYTKPEWDYISAAISAISPNMLCPSITFYHTMILNQSCNLNPNTIPVS